MNANIDKNNPLVSVAVVTYNSSATIIETLDSIAAQTYQNIELIVSDDCSPDNTVECVRAWMDEHKDRFVRCELIAKAQNEGTTANYITASNACQAEWIKDFDGDDILLPQAIQRYIDYINEHPDTVYVFAKIECFGGDEERRKRMTDFFKYDFFSWSLEQQYDYLTTVSNAIPSLTNFYNKKKVNELGITYDTRIRLVEDWPRWINVVKAGVSIKFIDEVLALYRMSDNSLSTLKTPSIAFQKDMARIRILYGFKNSYKKGNKKNVLYKYLRDQKLLHDDNLCWAVICKLYKIFVLIAYDL